MKFLKPVLILFSIVALTYTVSARNVAFNQDTISPIALSSKKQPVSLPVNGDLIFAFTAIATLGGYMIFKK